jgi:hypothetical protein
MSDTMFRRPQRKYCILTHQDVNVNLVVESLHMEDGSRQDRVVSLECPHARKCVKKNINCLAVSDRGKDPFVIETNLLKDLW